jgi:hypothetical protein
MEIIINNSLIPLNKDKLLEELRKKGIPEATIESINWRNCIEDGYCIYNDKKRKKTCFTKIKNKNNNLCSIHKNKKQEINDIDEIENMFKNMDIDKSDNIEYENNNMDCLDNISETYCNTEIANTSELNNKKYTDCLHLTENEINNLYNNLNILLDNINNYKKGLINMNILSECISNYNNNIYKVEEEPHICISFLLQFFEELYELSNCFLNNIINNYDNFNIFIELCQKWKMRIKEITNEIIIIPDYYQEYYCMINKKINNNLFKILN